MHLWNVQVSQHQAAGCLLCRPLDALMKNLNCNAVSAVQITHHFVQRLVSEDVMWGFAP